MRAYVAQSLIQHRSPETVHVHIYLYKFFLHSLIHSLIHNTRYYSTILYTEGIELFRNKVVFC